MTPGVAGSVLELGEVPEECQCLWVSQRIRVFDGPAMDHIANRQLSDLAADGPGDVRNGNDALWHMMGTGVFPDPAPDPFPQGLIQRATLAQADEQHDAHVALPLLADDKAFDHLRQLLHLAVDLRRADTHPARVERRVTPALDHKPAVRREN